MASSQVGRDVKQAPTTCSWAPRKLLGPQVVTDAVNPPAIEGGPEFGAMLNGDDLGRCQHVRVHLVRLVSVRSAHEPHISYVAYDLVTFVVRELDSRRQAEVLEHLRYFIKVATPRRE